MLKEIMGATVSIILVIYMLWFIFPELKTAYSGVLLQVNQTNPTMVAVLTISNGWFSILPLFIVFIGGFTVWLYVSRRGASDYE